MNGINQGFVYIIHFENKFHHAQHYIGFTVNVPARMEAHQHGNGSKLMRAVSAAGIKWRVAAILQGDRALERKLHNRHKTSQICPVCQGKIK